MRKYEMAEAAPVASEGWTPDRVELLKKRWSEGLSASQIAARLGGVTRNAVIGKVHRLGLAARVTRSPRTKSARRTARRIFTAGQFSVRPPRLAVVPQMLEMPPALRIDLLDLREMHCRWPIGDPQDNAFHFCGRQKATAIAYCEHHARLAYQPAVRRKR